MTTAQKPAPPSALDDTQLTPGFRGYILIPLAEFGQSLDSPDLDTWFEAFAGRHKDEVGDFEITARGELKIMPPTGFPGEWQEATFAAHLVIWSEGYGGRAGGPTARFWLADGSLRGPDAYWFSWERWNALPAESRTPPFARFTPDFVVEIVSPSNRGPELEDKVQRYLQGGAQLIWVINARRRLVTVYRPGAEPEVLNDPERLEGDDVLPGFVFHVRERIFDNVP
jgi:Uma2 family endonuclease